MSERVGTVRPSQLMYSYGIGSVVDLPNLSVVVGGLDGWDFSLTPDALIVEERLLQAVRATHPHAGEFRRAPWLPPEPGNNALADWARVGVPAYVFPRWLRCTACSRLAPVESHLFEFKGNPFRPDQATYEHKNCDRARGGKPPRAIPARFVLACRNGHLDDFPWDAFAHSFGRCSGKPLLAFVDIGTGSRSTDALVKCLTCQDRGYLGAAFGQRATESMPQCRGRHPHLRRFDHDGCKEQARAMLLGASNSWFPETRSALALPVGASGSVAEAVDDHWVHLGKVGSRAELDSALKFRPEVEAALAKFDLDEVWAVIDARRSGMGVAAEPDLLAPEWELLTDPLNAPQSKDFRLRKEPVPAPYTLGLSGVVLAERLREVVALIGFTRVEGPDSGLAEDAARRPSAPLDAKGQPGWLPASEVRGEGIFIQLNEDTVEHWVAGALGSQRVDALLEAHKEWRARRGLAPVEAGWQGPRYLLVHSLSHAIINQVALECGYAAASVRERLYVREADDGSEAMAGVLLYTAAPDAEGTLGGLVRLGREASLKQILENALERLRLCSADPFCAEHVAKPGEEALHNAACHACLFVPETSCERGNRYLDRAVLTPTMAGPALAPYFPL
jgi:hypothetical protein